MSDKMMSDETFLRRAMEEDSQSISAGAPPIAPPERIRVVVRAGKPDWIGVAYAAETSDPSRIHEYINAARVERLEQALRGSTKELSELLWLCVKPNTSMGDFEARVEPAQRAIDAAHIALNDERRSNENTISNFNLRDNNDRANTKLETD